jgi:hypothetical protein
MNPDQTKQEGNAGSYVRLDATDLRAALFTVAHYLRTVPASPPSLWLLRDKLNTALTSGLSLTGHECGCGEEGLATDTTEWIGARLAAEILGCTERHARRRLADLGGRRIGATLMFDAAAVREYAKALQENGEHCA